MRIADVEEKMIHGDCSAETLALFQIALKHIPKAVRCQHCYTTAAALPPHLYKQALALIQYGLTEHCDSWLDRMRSHHNSAIILEAQHDYIGSNRAFAEALASIQPDLYNNYASEYASHLMRTEMHISNFEYTDELERLYDLSVQADPFSQAFQKTTFYRLLAEIIISIHRKNITGAKEAYHAANEMLHPGFMGPLTQLLKRKGFIESTGATREALVFLHKAKQWF